MIFFSRPHRRRRRQNPDEAEHQNILLKSPPMVAGLGSTLGSGFKIEYCTPIVDAVPDHVCPSTLSRQQPSGGMTDVEYAYGWKDANMCARPMDKLTTPTYCAAPIKYSNNDYATWSGGNTPGGYVVLGGDQHDGCAELSSSQVLANKSVPSDTYHLDLGCGPCNSRHRDDLDNSVVHTEHSCGRRGESVEPEPDETEILTGRTESDAQNRHNIMLQGKR